MKNENVLCVATSQMKDLFNLDKELWTLKSENDLNRLNYSFIQRIIAENDAEHKQLIPYAVVFDTQGKILTYQRCGSEKRLFGLYSVGIGGHVNDHDKGDILYEKLQNGLMREFGEEVGMQISADQMQLVGMINEEHSDVGHCHTGVVFKIQLHDTPFAFDKEIGDQNWMEPSRIDLSKCELWSALALKLILK